MEREIKRLYKQWNPDDVAHDDNDDIKIELKFLELRLLNWIASSLSAVAFGDDPQGESLYQQIMTIPEELRALTTEVLNK